MLLHHDRELFEEVIYETAVKLSLPVAIVEKDYYVTMILRELAEQAPDCVFKGGTSLAKCYHVIDRFSEDIDISFTNSLTQGEKKKLKNVVIAGISKSLDLPIVDWENARSRRNYNCYTFSYQPIGGMIPKSLMSGVKMEVVLGSISFPTVELDVDSLVYQYLSKDNMDLVEYYGLRPFPMKLQSIERTFVDKVFALCDYYMQGNIHRHSRHIYDLYMIVPKIRMDDELKNLVIQVRKQRAQMSICPSAADGINISEMLKEIAKKGIYERDYETITSYFQNHPVVYDKVISVLEQIADSNLF